MIRSGTGAKTGARMGHMSVSGPDGTLAAFAGLDVRRKILIHINNTNPILLDDSPERAAGRGGRLGGRLRRHGDRAVSELLTPERAGSGAAPDRRGALPLEPSVPHAMKGGELTKAQVQAWALNRYYYQSRIPIKDAAILARMEDPRAAPGLAPADHRPRRRARRRGRHRALAQADRQASAWTAPT